MFRPDLRSIVCLLILTMRPVVVEAAPDKGDAGKANTHTWSVMDFGWLPDPGQKIVRPHVPIEPDGQNGFELKLNSVTGPGSGDRGIPDPDKMPVLLHKADGTTSPPKPDE